MQGKWGFREGAMAGGGLEEGASSMTAACKGRRVIRWCAVCVPMKGKGSNRAGGGRLIDACSMEEQAG